MFRSIDIYCERTAPGLLAEPINALTNLAFFLAAWLVLRQARAEGRLDGPLKALIGLVFAIGTGSLLWHTFAQAWAGAADVIPILLFIVTYVGLSMWRFFGAGRAEAVALAVAFLFFAPGLRSAAAAALPEVMRPSFGYLPALVALVVCGGLLMLRRHPAGLWLLGAGAVFVVSLTFRALDEQVCAGFPAGTHFMWHVLNAVVLGTLMTAWLRHGAARPPAGA
jgi:hypothetical protein